MRAAASQRRRSGIISFPLPSRVAVCCSVLQCVAVCCSALQHIRKQLHHTAPFVVACCSALYCVAVRCNTQERSCIIPHPSPSHCIPAVATRRVKHCVASVLQSVAVRCNTQSHYIRAVATRRRSQLIDVLCNASHERFRITHRHSLGIVSVPPRRHAPPHRSCARRLSICWVGGEMQWKYGEKEREKTGDEARERERENEKNTM